MSEIKIERPTAEKLKELQIPSSAQETGSWSVWECEPSTFDWSYSQTEIAYVYEGKVKVKTPSGEVEINKGDLVTFPKDLSCTWEVIEPVKKVYTFR